MDGSGKHCIELAIRLADANFNPPNHRPNARKVIVIIASAFESGRYNDPIVAANTFKEDGGIIITIEYVQVHGAPVPLLDTLASPGYALSNRHGKVDVWDLHRLFCKANCFCPTNYRPFKIKGDIPYGGCYKMSTLPAIQPLAQRSCRRHFNGTLTVVENKAKAEFLVNSCVIKLDFAQLQVLIACSLVMRSNASFWIGLRYKDHAYRWMNDVAMNDGDFTLWATHYPDAQQGDCVKMEKCDHCERHKIAWYNDYCGRDMLYTCQAVACSTDHYCPLIR
ncbi:lectin C-type domain protein [Oesophagostomum dentatum]|uniref:Lectin C-type domain protein n=1 Tax=Oesophagostomum dentatum TaxID=61180 RepID=A0A0B1SQL3_OESDE|nr:lectin C-type domain protein [Oesophagostomum dentatum]